jgi:hypothetical protein
MHRSIESETVARRTMTKRKILSASLLLLLATDTGAWGPEGHRIVGQAAFGLLDAAARAEVLAIFDLPPGADPDAALDTACNWPDSIREEPGWRWSAPLHYVNVSRLGGGYQRERDCPDGRCVTEGILEYASRLGYGGSANSADERYQALAFVCHLVADLHQPLHAGFRDDRGGNNVQVEYRGEEMNLHRFWDAGVVRTHLRDESEMVDWLTAAGARVAAQDWKPGDVVEWTNESHALAAGSAYPAGRVIDDAFADRSWSVTVVQWERAAGRLAQVLNAVLGGQEVLLETGSEIPGDPETDAGVPRSR